MASKNKFNIVLGVTLNKEMLQKQLNQISNTPIKIQIDVAHLRAQIQSVFKGIKIDIGGKSATIGGVTGQTEKESGMVSPTSEITQSLSTTTYYDKQKNDIKEIRTGYNALGQAIKEVNAIRHTEAGTVTERISSSMEEGSLINKNATAYENLSSRLQHLQKNGQINANQAQEFSTRLENVNKGIGKTGERLNEVGKSKAFKQLGQDMSDAGKHAMTFGSMLKTAFSKFVIWSAVTVAWYAFVRALKDVVKQVIALDKAFTRLQMVTNATSGQIEKMKSEYISLAKEMNVSLSTITDAAEAWLRTGMNAADATEALKASTILATDAFMDGATATQYLVAAQKAYGLEANELINVVDKLTTLDTKAATTAADLGEALSMSASSAGLAGISMDKYLAILATTSETTQQSASTIGNAWKTILARLQEVKLGKAVDEEGEDISNVDKLLKEYNIDLMKATDNLENMEGLLDTLGKNWKNYTAAQKSEIATVVAGTRQRDKLIATLNNYDRVLELTEESIDSVGSAQKKFDIYADSTEAKINKMKTAWTELADATLKSGVVEGFVILTTKFEEFATQAGGLIPIVTMLAGAMMLLKGGVSGIIGGGLIVGAALTQMVEYSNAKWIEQSVTSQIQETEKLVQKQEQEKKEVSGLMSEYISLISIKERTDEQNKRLAETSQKLANSLGVEKESVDEIIDSYKEIAKAYQDFMLGEITKEIAEYSEQIETLEKKLSAVSSPTASTSLLVNIINSFSSTQKSQALIKGISDLTAQLDALKEEQEMVSTQGEQLMMLIGETKDWERSEAGAKSLKKTLDEMESVMSVLSDRISEIDKKLNGGDISDAERERLEATKSKLEDLLSTYQSFIGTIKSAYEEFVSTDFILTEYYDKQLKALKEQKELEDQLAKQKEKQEKVEAAELKKQEALLEVEKARAKLAEAKEKRIQVFRMGRGLVYEEDAESIASAQEELTKSLDNYASAVKDYDKVFADLYGTATEQLISAVEELERVYGYALLQNEAVREHFLTESNREYFMGLSQADQLKYLLDFIADETKKGEVEQKVQSEVAGMGQKAVEDFGLTDVIPSIENKINEQGENVRGGVFGQGGYFEGVVQKYLKGKETHEEDFDKVQGIINKFKLREGDRGRWAQVFQAYGVFDNFLALTDEERASLRGYHTGGIVGQSAFKSDTEMYAKLLKGEIVLPQNKFNNIIDKVRANTANNSSVMNIGNISLPSVTDADSFVNELQKISYAKA